MVNWFSTKVPRSMKKIIVFITTSTRTTDNPCGKKERKQKKKKNSTYMSYLIQIHLKILKCKIAGGNQRNKSGDPGTGKLFLRRARQHFRLCGSTVLLQICNSVIVAWRHHRQWVKIRLRLYSTETLCTKTSSGLNGL